jgi:hypothetical protein
MTKSTRRKLGASLALLAMITVTALALAHVPLVTTSEQHFDATGATWFHIHLHWPFVLSCIAFLAGLLLFMFSRNDHAA